MNPIDLISRISLKLAALSIVIALAACTISPSPRMLADERLFADALTISGRFAASIISAGRSQSSQGKFLWIGVKGHSQLEIFSPFGQSQMRLFIDESIDGQALRLDIPGQASYRDAVAESLLEKNLGFRLPYKAFALWLQRQPGSAEQARIERTAQGRIAAIHELGWIIDYEDPESDMVRRINLRHAEQSVEVRLVLDAQTLLE